MKQCLESILHQDTSYSYEIILGEDESSDGTREVCIDYANKFPDKIRLFLRSRKDVIYIDGKPTGRFNMIQNLSAAKGKYIAMCEGDDYWTDPLKLQKQVDFLENHPEFSMSFTRSEILDHTGNITDGFSRPATTYTLQDLLRGYNFIPTASVVYRAEHLQLPKEFAIFPMGDWFLNISMARRGKLHCLPEKTVVYRKSPTSMWSSQSVFKQKEKSVYFLGQLPSVYPDLKALSRARMKGILKEMYRESGWAGKLKVISIYSKHVLLK